MHLHLHAYIYVYIITTSPRGVESRLLSDVIIHGNQSTYMHAACDYTNFSIHKHAIIYIRVESGVVTFFPLMSTHVQTDENYLLGR